MDLLFGSNHSPENALHTFLESLPAHSHLDSLTEILTLATDTDERVAEFMDVVWQHICRNSLWSSKYNNFQDYCDAIDYNCTVWPVIQRHKKTDRAKRISAQTILRQWNVPVHSAIPVNLQPPFWSKHLLSLIATLSRHTTLDEACVLLRTSVGQRPRRGRNHHLLLASDVQRVLDHLNVSRKGAHRTANESNGSDAYHPLYQGVPVSKQHSQRGIAQPGMTVYRPTSSGNSSPQTRSTSMFSEELAGSPETVSSELESYADDTSQAKLPSCRCAPICLPLVLLLSSPNHYCIQLLAAELVNWAHTISWRSLCYEHLKILAKLVTQEYVSDRNRVDIIHTLEGSLALNSGPSHDLRCIIEEDELHTLQIEPLDLLCRYAGLPDGMWGWERDGLLHIPGFFDYMERLGVFKRVRMILGEDKATQSASNLPSQCSSPISLCYSLLAQMVQQDPAYYAILVSCRPDKNWKLIHRPRRSGHTFTFRERDVALGVSTERARSLVNGDGASDIQSTVVLPGEQSLQTVQLIPTSQQYLPKLVDKIENQGRQPPSSLPDLAILAYDKVAEQEFGTPQNITLGHGDLILASPKTLRLPQTFSASNLLNMSQSGLGNDFNTLENGRDGMWTRLSIISNCHRLGDKYLGADEGWADSIGCDTSVIDSFRMSYASALGEALVGRREWRDPKVILERNLVLGNDIFGAVEFVGAIREQLAADFHNTLDLLRLGQGNDGSGKFVCNTSL
ncbi:hypothetical protein ETB97_009759 [Aspergillus alliaceus]|uniref:Uncharacterized protein n=1 Tax=Petromyces alliaceus TaxID=209559 RepID=A0A8H5ZU35_PETAA|nr:hypothetical protein ETB97_009759 [Aspergillus burnettii]